MNQPKGKTIVIRDYDSGNSTDERRTAAAEESKITFACIYGALLAINNNKNPQPCMDTVEFTANLLNPKANNYLTVYCPIMDYKF